MNDPRLISWAALLKAQHNISQKEAEEMAAAKLAAASPPPTQNREPEHVQRRPAAPLRPRQPIAAKPIPEGAAPYRFVPLNPVVVASPARGDGATQRVRLDVPHPDGLCGEIKVRWTAETGILVGDTNAETSKFFELNGRYAIPGATLKGAVRSVLENAAYGRMGRFNDHLRFGWREFSDPEYHAALLEDETRIKAGWLSRGEGGYQIETCAWYTVPLQDVARKCGHDEDAWRSATFPAVRGNLTEAMREKTRKLGQAGLLADKARFTPSGDGRRAELVDTGGQPGTVVVAAYAPTNQRDQTRNRKREFVFDARRRGKVSVTEETIERFDQMNSTPGRNRREATGAWAYWRPRLDQGEEIPVFFVEDDKEGLLLGLTRLFRLPQKMTPGDALRQCRGHSNPSDEPDFVEGLFGRVEERQEGQDAARQPPSDLALKGRVSFGFATAEHDKRSCVPLNKTCVLMTPRPSFEPFYLQNSTYLDGNAKLAGRKRYPVGVEDAHRKQGRPSPAGTEQISSRLELLSPTTKDGKPLSFTSVIRFHNVLPEELGALLWALSFGKPGGPYRHGIGRGKPFGLGQVKAEVTELILSANRPEVGQRYAGAQAEQECRLLKTFEAFMEDRTKATGGWAAGPVIPQLRRMADPAVGRHNADALRYPDGFAEYARYRRQGERLKPLAEPSA